MGAYIAIDIGFAGVDRDVDGYWVALDRDSFLVHVVDSIAFRKVLPGTHSVVLRRVAANCAVATDTLRTATFAAGDTLRLRWDVTCAEVTARRLLFSSAFSLYFNADIYVRNPHDTLPTNLTRTPAREWQPAWSPDGLRIVFVSDRTGRDEIHVMNADGTGVVQLTNAPGGNAFPTWSPDGTRIAFVSARGGRNALYVMNADGTGQTRFTTDTAAENFPDWAPDGLHVAYVRGCLECIPAFTEVYLTNGTDTTRLTSQARANYRPVWSPDGARIAFFSQERLTLMDADGSHIVRVGEAFPIERAPSWSPDSKQLAYVYYGAIHRIRFDGTGDTLLTGGGGPAWSGDGNLIAFVTLSCGPYGGCSADLAIMRTDGAQIVTLVVGAPGVDRPQWDP
jgi:Tol biopolymer transport system component